MWYFSKSIKKTKYAADGRIICWFDKSCKQTDESHFIRFAHPSMEYEKVKIFKNKIF
jgi:hypothetical protein